MAFGGVFAVFRGPFSAGALQTLVLQPDATAGVDVTINTNSPTNNYGVTTYLSHGYFSSQRYRHLIKLDLSSVPAGAVIVSATMQMTCWDAGVSNDTVNWYLCKRAWIEGTRNNQLDSPATGATWNRYDTTNNWETAGCDGSNDRGSTVLATTTHNTSDSLGVVKTFALDRATVQAWVNGSVANNGLICIGSNESTNSSGNFCSSDHATASYRPKITIVYEVG